MIGMVLSLRALDRLSDVNRRIQRIVAGDLRERLPTRGSDDPFDQLAVGVNRMLGEIEALIHEIAGVGDDIAHDLRTPLTRVRVRPRARPRARRRRSAICAPSSISRSTASTRRLAIVTALLRIAEIEHSRRLGGFSTVALAPLLREVGDLYEPIAEDKQVAAAGRGAGRGDRARRPRSAVRGGRQSGRQRREVHARRRPRRARPAAPATARP